MTEALPNLLPALPEIILAIGALALLMIGVFSGEQSTGMVNGLAVALIVIALVAMLLLTPNGITFSGGFVQDSFARLMKFLTLVGSGVSIVMSAGYARKE